MFIQVSESDVRLKSQPDVNVSSPVARINVDILVIMSILLLQNRLHSLGTYGYATSYPIMISCE